MHCIHIHCLDFCMHSERYEQDSCAHKGPEEYLEAALSNIIMSLVLSGRGGTSGAAFPFSSPMEAPSLKGYHLKGCHGSKGKGA